MLLHFGPSYASYHVSVHGYWKWPATTVGAAGYHSKLDILINPSKAALNPSPIVSSHNPSYADYTSRNVHHGLPYYHRPIKQFLAQRSWIIRLFNAQRMPNADASQFSIMLIPHDSAYNPQSLSARLSTLFPVVLTWEHGLPRF